MQPVLQSHQGCFPPSTALPAVVMRPASTVMTTQGNRGNLQLQLPQLSSDVKHLIVSAMKTERQEQKVKLKWQWEGMSHTQSNPFAGGLLQPKHSFASCCPPTLVFGKKQGCFYLFLSAPEEQALRVHKIVIYMIKVTPAKVSEKAKFSHRPQRSKSSPTTLLPSFVVCEVQVLNPEQDFVGYKTNIRLS